MNRNDEYRNLIQELEENAPDLSLSVEKAKRRRGRRRLLTRPLGSLAAMLALFVLLVNCSPTVAQAVSEVPVLGELAEAVRFSRSLHKAVEHEYVQSVDQTQTENGISATVEYLIVDQKQLHVFFRMESRRWDNLRNDVNVACETMNGFYNSFPHVRDLGDGLWLFSMDFWDRKMPPKVDMTLMIYEHSGGEQEYFWQEQEAEREYLAELTFALEFDPEFCAPGRSYELNRELILDDQRFLVTKVEVYPTNLYVHLEENPQNTAWLSQLSFYVQTGEGDRFRRPDVGVVSSGVGESKSHLTYRADSPWFYGAEQMELVITGAALIPKETKSFRVDLNTAEAVQLPEELTLLNVERDGEDWLLHLRCEADANGRRSVRYDMEYLDPEGGEHTLQWTSGYPEGENPDNATAYLDTLRLRDYPYDSVQIPVVWGRKYTLPELMVVPIE